MPKVVNPQDAPIRALGYSPPKCGKTRLFTSLPWGHPRFGDKAVYFAWDPGSENLGSVRREDREHLIVVRPDTEVKKFKGEEYTVLDAHKEAHKMASYNWEKEYGVKNLIWDTMTTTGQMLLHGYANAGVFSGDSGDKHITVGTKGEPGYMALPMQGDYGSAQLAIDQIVDSLFANQNINVFVLCHADISSPSPDVSDTTFGGPATVGQKGISRIAGKFDNLFRLDVRPAKAPASGNEYKVYTTKKGIWLGGMRTPDATNPLPEFVLGRDGATINPADFWKRIAEIQYGPTP